MASFNIKRDFYQDVYIILNLINNMDHMRISGTEPSSVVLSQRSKFESLKRDVPNVPKQAEANRGGVINPQNYNVKQFYHGKF